MSLLEFQIGISGPVQNRKFGLTPDQGVRFNYRMNALADRVLRALQPWDCGEVSKIAVMFTTEPEYPPRQGLGILIVDCQSNPALLTASNDVQPIGVFKTIVPALSDVARSRSWDLAPLHRLQDLEANLLQPHRFGFGKPVKRRSDKAIANGYVDYGMEQVTICARVVTHAGTAHDHVLWKGAIGETYWSQFSGLLGGLKWLPDGRLALVPRKSWRGEAPPAIEVL